jgi:hypothetical protein
MVCCPASGSSDFSHSLSLKKNLVITLDDLAKNSLGIFGVSESAATIQMGLL